MAKGTKKHWGKELLTQAVARCSSVRQVLAVLELKESGGNYLTCKRYIQLYSLDTSHFTGRLWSKGKKISRKPVFELSEILVKNGTFQSHKLKKRLFAASLKRPVCEECGWNRKSADGRILVELDHINGESTDNRLENLRILCPNCHSLKHTHRGSNIARRRRGDEIGRHSGLKTRGP